MSTTLLHPSEATDFHPASASRGGGESPVPPAAVMAAPELGGRPELSPAHRLAGVLVPLFALRGEGDLGIGDTRALKEFISWAVRHGFRLVQILPINETGADNSPYNAISSTALDPALLRTDPGALPWLDTSAFQRICAAHDLDALRAGPVDYPRVKALKRRLFEEAFACFPDRGPGAECFEAFRRARSGWLEDYALYRTLMDEHGTECWDQWPEGRRFAPSARKWLAAQPEPTRKAWRRRMDFHIWVQWVAFTQWQDVKAHCDREGAFLMGDVPIGVSYYSADVFSRPEIFDLTWSGGAPPERIFKSDPFTEKWGQNWGIPHYRWDVLRARDYDWWRQRVSTVCAVFDLFRIDHVLGFYRIFSFPWRPQENSDYLPLDEEQARTRTGGRLPGFLPRDDSTPENRAANRAEGEALLRMVLEEVGENRLVAEDLGVVPDYVRPSLASLGIAGFKIPLWETKDDGHLIPGAEYPRLSLATYATHDHAPICTTWNEWAEALRTEGSPGAHAARAAMQQLLDYAGTGLRAGPLDYNDPLREALMAALFNSNAWMAVAMVNDLFGTAERFNVPGAVADTNWSRRLDLPVAAWDRDPAIGPRMSRITGLVRESGRF